MINPRHIDTPNHPLGLLYIGAQLEKDGFEVRIFDQEMDTPPAETAGLVMAWGPDVAGITATTPQFGLGLKIAAELKSAAKGLPVVFGGPHPCVRPEETLASPVVDFVVLGEGEAPMSGLCRCLADKGDPAGIRGVGYKTEGRLRFTPPADLTEDLDSIPFPARHLLSSRWYFAPPRIRGIWTKSLITVMASRGCPYRCIWCSSYTVFGRKVRFRSPENILEEIRRAKADFGVDSVYFVDDTFTVNPKWVEAICDKLIAGDLKGLKWACQARVNTVTPALLAKMKAAGCVQLDFGVESGSQKILDILKKDTTIPQIKAAFAVAKRAGLQVFASVIVGTPGETKEDVMMTLRLLKELEPDYTDIFYATPYPGTRLYEIAKEMNAISDPSDYDSWYVGKQIDNPIMTAGFSKEELIGFRSMLENQVFWWNYRTLLRNPSFILGSALIFLLGLPGLPRGLRRLISTGKLDSVFVEMLRHYRKRGRTI